MTEKLPGKVQVGDQMIDVLTPQVVQICVHGRRVWINVDGVCRLRVYNFKKLEVETDGGKPKVVPQPGKETNEQSKARRASRERYSRNKGDR